MAEVFHLLWVDETKLADRVMSPTTQIKVVMWPPIQGKVVNHDDLLMHHKPHKITYTSVWCGISKFLGVESCMTNHELICRCHQIDP
jgi:hypothetical protein